MAREPCDQVTRNFPPYKKSRPLATHKSVYLPLLPGTVGHEQRSYGACWPRGCAPLLLWRAAREGLASLLPRPQALSSIKPAVALPAELRRCACERRRCGRRTTLTEACFGPKQLQHICSAATYFLCTTAFAALYQLVGARRSCATVSGDKHFSTCFKVCTPSICQPLNVRIACSLTLCLRRLRRAPLRWPAPGSSLTRLN